MNKKILIIEDDTSILRGLKDNLELEGYKVITETNGAEGLKLALEKKMPISCFSILCFPG